MSKLELSVRNIIGISVGILLLLFVVSLVEYESLSKVILAFIEVLKPGR